MFNLSRILIGNVGRRVLKSTLMTQSKKNGNNDKLLAFKSLQCKYQAENGLPIWLKGGIGDSFLYTLTMLGCGGGLAGVFNTIYNLAIPSTWKCSGCSCDQC